MQRPIEFRVWDKAENEFAMLSEYTSAIKWFEGSQRNLDSLIIQQFTGLLDQNKNKIFEGDIVKYNYDGVYKENKRQYQIFQVIWCNFYKAWALADGNGQSLNHTGLKFYNLDTKGEVVGNIFQTPKLLKQ